MRRIALLTLIAGLFPPLLAAAPASAQATRTWVSGVGDDANPCSRTAPCKTFAGAISKTAAAGEINCIDPGGYGAVTITKSITVSCESGTAGVLVSGTNAIIVSAAATDFVYLKGLDIEGLGTGLNGVVVNSAALVQIEDCIIRRFTGFGIQIKPSSTLTFVVQRTSLFNNLNGASGGGVQIRPTGGFTSGSIEKSAINGNATGISVDGFGGGTGINLSVRDTFINGNTGAAVLATSTVAADVMVMESIIANNATGLTTANAAIIRTGSSIISGNGTATSGAGVLSYGNNQINGNGADTIPAGVATH